MLNNCPICFKGFDRNFHKKSKDHIPPKTIYAGGYPKNMNTFKVCYGCNNKTSSEDEIFGVIIKLAVQMKSNEFVLESIIKTLSKQHKIAKDLFSDCVFLNNGYVKLKFDELYREKVEIVILKMIKILYFHQYNGFFDVDDFNYEWLGLSLLDGEVQSCILLEQSQIRRIFNSNYQHRVNEGTFKYMLYKDEVDRLYVKMSFFDEVEIWAFFQRKI